MTGPEAAGTIGGICLAAALTLMAVATSFDGEPFVILAIAPPFQTVVPKTQDRLDQIDIWHAQRGYSL